MKRHLFCVLLATLLSLSIPAQDAGAQQVRLKANLQFPISNPVFGAGLRRFKEEVERETKNAVVIDIFDNSQLASDYEVVDKVASGEIDVGMTAAQQFSYKVPLVAILDQPFLFNFQALMNAAAKPGSEIRQVIDEEIMARIGVRVLWWQSLGNNVIFSKGRDVADPARLKGQRVAAPGALPGEFIGVCGGTPVPLTIEKFTDAFKAGALDMAVLSLGAVQTRGLWQFMDTVTFTHHSPVEFFVVINGKRWHSLSPEHRSAIAQAAMKVESEIESRQAASEASARAFAASKNMKLQELTPDQVADWRACSSEMLADYMEKNGEGARRLMDAYGRLRKDPCCSAMPGEIAFTRH